MYNRTHITPDTLPKEIKDAAIDMVEGETPKPKMSEFVEAMAEQPIPEYMKRFLDEATLDPNQFDGDTLSVVTLDSIPDNGPQEEIAEPQFFNNRKKRRADRKKARRSSKTKLTKRELIDEYNRQCIPHKI